MSGRAVEAASIIVIALAVLVGGKNVLSEIARFPVVALTVLATLGILEVVALRRDVALGGGPARFRVTRDAAFIAATIAAIAFVYAPARWSIGTAIAGLEFALVLELLARMVPNS
jgi:hypothetical protein